MATWGDLKKYKWGELAQMQLSYSDLKNLSDDKLLDLAKVRLDRFKTAPDTIRLPADWFERIQPLLPQEFTYEKHGSQKRIAEAVLAGLLLEAITSPWVRNALIAMIQIIGQAIGFR